MAKQAQTVLLRQKGSKHSQGFAPDHAERLLAYPKTEWEAVAEEESPKAPAAAAKKKPVAAADALPEVDTTGHPTTV